ncbi:hypothetical protein LPB136_06540 [Tenacibaculum todarodis]|uniref:O-antigen ligase-related domain-containing protein n=1 Tax=Tenacibaculum todarodis TaxID=1850252 RepID=A0A1L3JIR7_9FLAO|nr:hypothetical protein LPB136_06540 [Tenacibaculum todarodis]
MLVIFFNGKKIFHIKSKLFIAIVFFWIIMFVKIIYSFYYSSINYPESILKYVFTFFGVLVLPSLSILATPLEKINFKFIIKILFITLIITALLSVFSYDFNNLESRLSKYLKINPIALGYIGANLGLISGFLFFKNKRLIFILTFLLAILLIALSASRGALISLFISLLLSIIFNYNIKLKNKWGYFIGFNVFLIVVLFLSLNYNLAFSERILKLFYNSDESLRQRTVLWLASIKGFLNNPFLGNTFLISLKLKKSIVTYPHNFIFESFYTGGIIGGMLYLYILLDSFKKALKILVNSELGWISLIFIQFIIFGLLSSSIYFFYQFWLFLFLILSVSLFLKENKNNNKFN